MTSSGYKRGLATAAVSALAMTGVPFMAGAAHASPITDQYAANQVELLSQVSGKASLKNDGQNTTVRLEAGGGANVSNVTFQYQIGAGPWTNIATVGRNDDGAFSTEWDATALAGATVNLRAQSVNATTADPDLADDRAGVTVNGGGAGVESVNLNDGSDKGVFHQPYTDPDGAGPLTNADVDNNNVIVSGTTSSTGAPNVSFLWFSGANPNGAAAGSAPVTGAGPTGAFKGTADITGYNFVGTPDQVSIGAVRDSDDVETYALYDQVITTVDAAPATVDNPGGPNPTITITVKDQNGNPISGAEVRKQDGTFVGMTDSDGKTTTTQGNGTQYYYANATDSDAYEPSVGDKKSNDVTVTPYTPAPASLTATSRDGNAFDINEVTGGDDANDFVVQVKDQKGNNIDTTSQTLNYYWVRTPFAGTAATPTRYPASGTSTATETGTGQYNVQFPAGGLPGTYELHASLNEVPVTGGGAVGDTKVLENLKAGNARFVFDEEEPEQALNGTDEAVGVKLVLEDGTGLPGRPVQFSLANPSVGANAQYDQTAPAPDAPTYSTVTDANGHAVATLDDPNADTSGENVDVNVQTTNWVHSGDTDNAGADTAADDGAIAGTEDDPQTVQFVYSLTPASVVITDTGDAEGTAGAPESAGDLADYTVTVRSADDPNTAGDQSVLLVGQAVTLTVDHGYLTDGIPQGAIGSEAGVYDNDTQTKNYTTNGSGQIVVQTSIGRDAGFDDDGDVTAKLTATAGAASANQNTFWTSENPLNAGSVEISFAEEEEQDSTILPQARANNQTVYFDVKAFDQFGNRVGNEPIPLSDNTDDEDATVSGTVTDYSDGDRDGSAFGTDDVTQKVTATWTQPGTLIVADGADPGTDPDAAAPNSSANETVMDDITIEWYQLDADASTFTLDDNTEGTAQVGDSVTMTVTAVDQEGQPIQGAWVEFVRNGPAESDGDINYATMTDSEGVATYNFSGTARGTARITAVVRDFAGTTQWATLEDTVVFEEGTPEKQAIEAELLGADNGADDDVLTVNAPSVARGTVVKLFKIKRDGSRKLVGEDVLNDNGNRKFTVNEPANKEKAKKARTFIAVVKEGEFTLRAESNTKTVK